MYFPTKLGLILLSAAACVSAAANPNEARQFDSAISSLTSVAGSIGTEIASGAESVGSVITSAGAGVITTVVSGAGELKTVITSAGGQAITLAESGAGVVTSFAGSQYTVATNAISDATGSPDNSASAIQQGMLLPLSVLLGGGLVGAMMVL